VAFVAALPALWIAAAALWPRGSRSWRRAARQSLFATFLAGLVPTVLGILVVAAMTRAPKLGALAAFFAMFVLAWGFIGASGLAARVGERMWPGLRGTAPWREMRNGGLVLTTAALLPIIGWVIVLPLLAILGMGLQVRSWFIRDAAVVPPAAPPLPSAGAASQAAALTAAAALPPTAS
jgi:hypothetical protein